MAGRSRLKHEDYAPRAPLDCTRPGPCDRPTECRSVCLWKYEHANQAAALAYAKRNALHTVKDHIEHCKRLLAHSIGKPWPRSRMVEHWQRIADNPHKPPMSRASALQALANLHAERAPGED